MEAILALFKYAWRGTSGTSIRSTSVHACIVVKLTKAVACLPCLFTHVLYSRLLLIITLRIKALVLLTEETKVE